MKQNTVNLVAEMRRIAKAIEDGDSYEGHIEYSCLENGLEKDEWEVSGAYRIGNSMGQGGSCIMKRTIQNET